MQAVGIDTQLRFIFFVRNQLRNIRLYWGVYKFIIFVIRVLRFLRKTYCRLLPFLRHISGRDPILGNRNILVLRLLDQAS